MQVKSVYKYAKVSAFKAREVTRAIQGLSAINALDLLRIAAVTKKSTLFVLKTLKSAIANAENNHDLDVKKLLVHEAVVGEGPTFKRSQPKARGSAGPILKRSSHITIILTDTLKAKPHKKANKSKKHPSSTKKKAEHHEPEPPAAVLTSLPKHSDK